MTNFLNWYRDTFGKYAAGVAGVGVALGAPTLTSLTGIKLNLPILLAMGAGAGYAVSLNHEDTNGAVWGAAGTMGVLLIAP